MTYGGAPPVSLRREPFEHESNFSDFEVLGNLPFLICRQLILAMERSLI